MKNLSLLPILILLAGCSGSSSGGNSTADSVQETTCSRSKVQGTWSGHISGNSDTMTIDSNCSATSTYCASSSTVTFYEVNTNCAGGYDTCGTVRIYVNTSPNNPGCPAPATHMDCSFDTTSTTLHYYCSGTTTTYTR